MKRFFAKTVPLFFSLVLVLQFLFIFPDTVLAQGSPGPTSLPSPSPGTRVWAGSCVKRGAATVQGLECLLANIFTVILTLIGFAAFVMFVVAGFSWMLSGGNTKGMESARNTMTFAIVGIVVALSGFLILNLLADFTGIPDILRFEIPNP